MHNVQHIPSIIQSMAPAIDRYGYLAVGGLLFLEDFGILVPGETVLVAAAFYAGLGQLNILVVALIAFFAAILGDNIGFAIGNYGGHPLVERYGRYVLLNQERLSKAENFFNKYGSRVVTIARFIDGLRQLNGIIAGISEMKWARFLLFNVIGAALWVGAWTIIGYFGGSHIDTFLHVELYFAITVVGLFVLRIIYKHFRKQRQ